MQVTEQLKHLGWTSFFGDQLDPDEQRQIGRVAAEHRGAYDLYTATGEVTVGVSGRLRNNGEDDPLELPAVGDWVLADADSIQEVLARRTAFVRRAAGLDAVPQVIAANIDTVFLVAGLDGDLSSRRLERYLALTWQSGATPVVVLTKSDLVDDVDGALATVRSVVDDVNVHVVSNVTSEGIEDVRRELGEGITVAVLGSSGVGKSTLVNLLVVGQVQDIGGRSRRRPRAPYDHPPRAGVGSWWRVAARHSRSARSAALGQLGRPRRSVPRYRRGCRELPVQRLLARRGARLRRRSRRCRRRATGDAARELPPSRNRAGRARRASRATPPPSQPRYPPAKTHRNAKI